MHPQLLLRQQGLQRAAARTGQLGLESTAPSPDYTLGTVFASGVGGMVVGALVTALVLKGMAGPNREELRQLSYYWNVRARDARKEMDYYQKAGMPSSVESWREEWRSARAEEDRYLKLYQEATRKEMGG